MFDVRRRVRQRSKLPALTRTSSFQASNLERITRRCLQPVLRAVGPELLHHLIIET
jgi:hypothetical protein